MAYRTEMQHGPDLLVPKVHRNKARIILWNLNDNSLLCYIDFKGLTRDNW